MSDQEEDVPCLCRIYLESGQTIETVFDYLEWGKRGNDFQNITWEQNEESIQKYERALGRTFEVLNTINMDQITAITTITELE